MAVTALVMAGGKGKRLALPGEKPLLHVGGKPVIELVLAALKDAKCVDRVVVAVSPNTRKTTKLLQRLGVEIIMTPGKEYVSDMGFAVKKLGLQTVLAIGADMPLLSGKVLDDILKRFFSCGKPALAVAVPQATRDRLGLGAGYVFDCGGKQVVYAGVNVLDGSKIDEAEIEQEVCVLDTTEVAVNINTVDELRIAKEQYAKFRA